MSTKTKVALSAALLLGLCGAVMANDSGENHQDGGNELGPNPYMTFSPPHRTFNGGKEAFAKYSVRHHVVKFHVNR
jgi:hypothetical protein